MSKNFNYISFGNLDLIEGDIATIEMSRGRMFEYTPTEIEKRLEELGPAATEYLEQLPTFLCSEISTSSQSASMLIKFGRIREIEVTPKIVSASFETLIDFNEVTFENLEQARDIFDAGGLQLYRTHWAVRESDVIAILKKLAVLNPDLQELVDQQLEPTNDINPPAREKTIIGVAESVEEFLKYLYQMDRSEGDESFFRGHGNTSYELTPSLLRKSSNGSWLHLPNEDRLCKELLIAHYDEFQGDQYCFDRLVRMQHYGLPTRLLDISGNPLVALFFACDGTQIEDDGEVIVFQVASERVKYYDSDTVSCIANLSNLTFEQKNKITSADDVVPFNSSEVGEKLLHLIKSEKGYFEPRILPSDLGSVVCVKAKQTNTRIRSQAGLFLLFGNDANLPESGSEGISIARITIKNKAKIQSQLDRININAKTVYPSIDQTAQHLRNLT